MATKVSLAEQVKRMLSGGDPRSDSDIDIRELVQAVESARDRVQYEVLVNSAENAMNPSFTDTELFSQLVIKQSVNSVAGEGGFKHYIKDYLSLPDDKGLFYVQKVDKNTEFDALLRAQGTPAFWRFNIENVSYEGLVAYWVLRDTSGPYIWTIKNPNGLSVHLIPLTRELGDTVELPGGGFIDDMVVQRVYEMYASATQIPKDNLGDNVPKINR
tara:strand:- start:7891 stop:8535 length:645 start_codon:yes stop_codon:yes gene_type:complete